VRTDNRLLNLRWATFAENASNAHRPPQKRYSKLTEDQARELFRLYHVENVTLTQLGEEYDLSIQAVGNIASRQSWAEATRDLVGLMDSKL
ncbi:hypothetical protein ACI3PL_21960, partial [Lacticaseibacillus paracasei]